MPSPRPIVPEHPDRRRDPGMLAPERRQLDEWLDLYRETVLLKIAVLNAEQLATRSVEPSSLSLLGLVRHLAFVERY